MLRRLKNLFYRFVVQNLTVKTVVGFIVVICLLKTLKYGILYYADIERYYVKIENLDIISGDFYCKSSITNNSCTLYTSDAMSMCYNLGDKCNGFTYNIGPRTSTLKQGTKGKPRFTLGVVTFYKDEYKDLLMLKETKGCAPVLEKKQSDKKISNAICNIPEIDPFDATVMKMIEKVKPLVCKGNKNLTFYNNGRLMITPGAKSKVKKVDYEVIRGLSNSGQGYQIFKTGTLTPSDPVVTLNEDMLYVEIQKTDNTVQKEFHMEVIPREEVLQKVPKTAPGIPLNIMMVGLDSTSHAHFRRKLGPIYKYLKDELESHIFNGYSILGDGTTVALIGMLVGRHFDELPEGRKGKLFAQCLDRWPWIFKDMNDHGYATYYNEDEVFNGAITTRLKGFCKPPIDHYLLPFWYSALEKHSSMYQKMVSGISYIKGHCLGSEAIYNVSLNTIKSFFKAYPKKLKFGFHMNSDFCHHEDFNFISLVEDDLLNFLKYFKKQGFLNNTLLVLFGDHGLRYGFVRSTVLGRMEERLPFLSMTFPPWFEKTYPELYHNLRKNSKVLSTPFDLHATFQHILSYPEIPKDLPHGKSLFTDIGWRTCEQAGIPFHFCPCVDWNEVEVDNDDVRSSALAVVEMMNERIANNGVAAKCAQLQLKRVISALLISSKGDEDEDLNAERRFTMAKTLKGGCMYQLQLETSPNNGIYESTVQLIMGIPKVNQHLSRVNKYNDESDCIRTTHPLLREFCYCNINDGKTR
ncbi:uncharacterized protein LOC114521988 isoform X1 [Dendronephthya gigantea]|uniref:uncharacterized protein LOC114521988 isoform X1 n=1 Tax=Dendronephthya gigantea TaxID=151771 RepID=UPI00106CBC9E|nr:uncharacterized protein LOC114521988 isoform X1 [Dendronephthya gigantea]